MLIYKITLPFLSVFRTHYPTGTVTGTVSCNNHKPTHISHHFVLSPNPNQLIELAIGYKPTGTTLNFQIACTHKLWPKHINYKPNCHRIEFLNKKDKPSH